jgi:hypothetical protein
MIPKSPFQSEYTFAAPTSSGETDLLGLPYHSDGPTSRLCIRRRRQDFENIKFRRIVQTKFVSNTKSEWPFYFYFICLFLILLRNRKHANGSSTDPVLPDFSKNSHEHVSLLVYIPIRATTQSSSMFQHHISSDMNDIHHRHAPVHLTKRLTPRKRVAAACAHCKKSRMRCDDVRPCKRCIRSGKDSSCTLSPDIEKQSDQDAKMISSTFAIWSASGDSGLSEASPVSSGFNLFDSNLIRSPQTTFSQFNINIYREHPCLGSHDQVVWRRPFPPAFGQHQMMDRCVSLVPALAPATETPTSFFQTSSDISRLHFNQPLRTEDPQARWQQTGACSEAASASLDEQIAHQQERIRELVARLPPNAALESLLLSAMLASPSTAPSSRTPAALDAAAPARTPPAAGAGGIVPARAPPALPPLPWPWSRADSESPLHAPAGAAALPRISWADRAAPRPSPPFPAGVSPLQ